MERTVFELLRVEVGHQIGPPVEDVVITGDKDQIIMINLEIALLLELERGVEIEEGVLIGVVLQLDTRKIRRSTCTRDYPCYRYSS